MKLLLTSNGITPQMKNEFLGLLQIPSEKCNVAFITTAAYGELDGPDWNTPLWLEDHRNILRNFGIKNIEDTDLKDKTQEDLEQIIRTKNAIYVNGGNTFYLLDWVRKSGFDSVLGRFLARGGVYVGVSAGSIIACPTIESAGWEPPDLNKVGLSDLTGLGFVNFLIQPHFSIEQKETLEKEVAMTSLPVVALTNEQAVLIVADKLQIIGVGDKYFFNGFVEKAVNSV